MKKIFIDFILCTALASWVLILYFKLRVYPYRQFGDEVPEWYLKTLKRVKNTEFTLRTILEITMMVVSIIPIMGIFYFDHLLLELICIYASVRVFFAGFLKSVEIYLRHVD